MRRLIPLIACIVLLGYAMANADEPATQPAGDKPIILLKLDDVGYWISPRWQRVADYLKEKQIHASFGVICESLTRNKPDTVKWIQDLQNGGQIEIWCHGWHLRTPTEKTGEYESGTADDQTAILRKCEDLSIEKLGFPLAAFGPHWSTTTDATDEALSRIPEIKIWLYGPAQPKFFKGLSIPRVMALEDPTFIPDFVKFQKHYVARGVKEKVLLLQGHPDQWAAPERWDGFTKIIDFLQQQGSTFMTPSEYLAHVQATTMPSTMPAN